MRTARRQAGREREIWGVSWPILLRFARLYIASQPALIKTVNGPPGCLLDEVTPLDQAARASQGTGQGILLITRH